MEAACKVYVDVTAHFDALGNVTPQVIHWGDGTHYKIDRVLDIRHAALLKAGCCGIRYTVRIAGQESYVWYEDSGRWFVEAKR